MRFVNGGARVGLGVVVWTLGSQLLLSCRSRESSGVPLAQLVVKAEIEFDSSFKIASVVGLPNEEILLSGASWGTVARVQLNTGHVLARTTVPGYRKGLTLSALRHNQVSVWAREPRLVGRLNTTTLALDSVRPFSAIGGKRFVGPTTLGQSGELLMAPFSDRSRPIRGLIGDSLPLVVRMGRSRSEWIPLGELSMTSGEYLTWLRNVGETWVVGQNLYFLARERGELFHFRRDDGRFHPVASLPRYMESPVSTESTQVYRWANEGGDFVTISSLAQVLVSAVDSHGYLVAVRPINAKRAWTSFLPPRRSPVFTIQEAVVERYDTFGKTLARLIMPKSIDPTMITHISIDGNGRLFVVMSRQSVLYVLEVEPPSPKRSKAVPARVRVELNDTPGDR